MTLEGLLAIDWRYRRERPKLFELSQPDPIAAPADVDAVEKNIGDIVMVVAEAFDGTVVPVPADVIETKRVV